MITLIIGLSLSFIAIGVLYYLNNELKKKLENNNKALLALQKEFTQYQVDEKRVKEKDIARMEIRHDNIAKSIKKNEDAIYTINKTLPNKIGKIVSQVEFAQNIINRK
jgi:cob(I)alamin adenosyltransferase